MAAPRRRLTAQNLKELGVCDMIINEPVGGAHRNKKAAITGVRRGDDQRHAGKWTP
jgi:acetyl-CoA carboxylase carboxyl transferase subunit alpha